MAGMPAQVVAQRQGRRSVESLQGYIRLSDPFESFLRIDLAPEDNPFDPEAVLYESTQAQRRPKQRKTTR